MKYALETIPVWDAVEDDSSRCFLCSLMEQAEQRVQDYYLGSSVMNPETRVQVNSVGFCPRHYASLAHQQKPQALALIAHTHLLQTHKDLKQRLDSLGSVRSLRKAKKQIEQIGEVLTSREQGCLICDSLEATLDRYVYTFLYLWQKDQEDFRSVFASSGGVCLHHMESILRMSTDVFSSAEFPLFAREFAGSMDRWVEKSTDDVYWMTQMYKSENAGEDWRGCEDAHKRAVAREVGTARID